MTDWLPFGVILGSGVLLTLLLVLLALRHLAPRPDLTWAWAAWLVTLLAASLALLGALRGEAPPPGSTPTPAPTPP